MAPVYLSLPQWVLLVDLDENGRVPMKGNLRAGKMLVALGLAAISNGCFIATEAGRARSREPR